ncbi:LamG-like jellyroll fold domain-containing protein [Okeania sp.]|uniref:LamG-like jellyroll fold domain-containing protein n=1 Tax=Okeania sp. TaxID=3100323 RepID=UPI002B4B92AF|nr:LamG-like jellyroll fold domain-containing protein [Okeania sp.]MEB3340848.1 LamG-like jellyroll fold domain-containing protein [Okeania sp.]
MTALSDAVVEGDENVKITLLSGTDAFGGTYNLANNREVLSLNGTTDYVEIPDANAIDFTKDQNFTVESWVKVDPSQNTEADIFEKWSGPGGYPYVIRLDGSTGKINAARYDGSRNPSIVSTATLNDAQYHHIAFVKEGSVLKLYIDGKLDGTTTDTTTGNTQNSSPLFVGQRGDNSNRFNGEVDELRIWNISRTQNEIRQNMYGSLTGNEVGLAGYWSFDSGSVNGNTITDLSSNNNNGTLNSSNNKALLTTGTAPLNLDSFVNYDNIYPAISRGSATLTSSTQVTGQVNHYMELGGNATTDLAFAGTANYTIAAWVKPDGEGTIVGKHNSGVIGSHFLRVQNDGRIQAHREVSPWELVSDTAIPFGQWSHVATTYDGATLKIYINGQLSGSRAFGAQVSTDTQTPVIVGARQSSGNPIDILPGSIDEVQIWNKALSETEIQNAQGRSISGNESGLVGYWDFNASDSSGASVVDLSGNGYNGTVKAEVADLTYIGHYSNGGRLSFNLSGRTLSSTPNVIGTLTSVLTDNPEPSFFIQSSDPSVSFFVEDSSAYQAGIAFSDRFGDQITANNAIVADSQGEATFQVKLTSQPTNNVTINLTSGSGTLNNNSLTFTPNNWDTYKTVNVTGLGATFNNFNVSASVTSNDSKYSSLSNSTLGVIDSTPRDTTKIKVTEGAVEQDIPPIIATVSASQDAQEGQPEPGQFTVNLSDIAPQGGYVVPYKVSGGTATEGTDYNVTTSDNNTKLGKSLNLDGQNDYLEIPDTNAIDFAKDQNFTVESWVQADPNQTPGGNTDRDIIEKWSGPGGYPYVIRYDRNNGKIVAARWDGTNGPAIVSTKTLNDGQYHHIAFVKDGSALKLYIDGQLEGTTTDTTTGNTQNNSPLFIGNRGGVANHFKGKVDELRIWNVARTEAEIQDSLNATFTGNETGLVGYWNFNNDSGTTATDLTSNNNDGTLKNGASLVDSSIGLLKIDAGQTSTNIGIEAIDNQIAQGDKTVTVAIERSNPASQATLNIKDDEKAGIEFAQLSKTATIEVPAIKLEVTTAYNSSTGAIGLKIAQGAQSYTFAADTTITFTNGVEIIIPAGTTLSNNAATVTVAQNLGSIPIAETSTTENRLLDVGILSYNEDSNGNVTANVQVRLTQRPAGNISVTLTDANGSDSAIFNFTNTNWNKYQQTNASNFLQLTSANNAVALTAKVGNANTINLPLSANVVATPLGNINTGTGNQLITTEGERIEFTATKAYDANAGTVEIELFNRSSDYTLTADQVIVFNNGTQARVTTDTALKLGQAKAVPVTLTQGTAIPVNQEGSVVLPSGETTVAVRLSSQPTSGNVGLDLTIDNSREGKFKSNNTQAETLTFTQQNWNQYQEVTVKGEDDLLVDGNITYNLNVKGQNGNADSNYKGTLLQSISITNEDNDRTPDPTQTTNNFNQPPIIADLTADKTQIDENGGKVIATFKLNKPAPVGGLNIEYEVISETASTSQDLQTPFVFVENNPLSMADRIPPANLASTNGDYLPSIVPVFVDWDQDGDLDVFGGEYAFFKPAYTEGITYYENTGDKNNPVFVQRTGAQNPLSSIVNIDAPAPAFIDIGNDGDLDVFIGDVDGQIHYFENTASGFVKRTGANNPFNSINGGDPARRFPLTPTFVDIDADKDLDFFAVYRDGIARDTVVFFENNGGNFVQRTGADNPLNGKGSIDGAVKFGDLDNDGDFDAVFDGVYGTVYYRNIGNAINPVFEISEQLSPFRGLGLNIFGRLDLVDIDNDNQLELFVGYRNVAFYEQLSYQNPLTVNIPEGKSQATVEIRAMDDAIVENKENFTVRLIDRNDESDVNETLTLEVTENYQVYTPPGSQSFSSNSVGLQIKQSSTLPKNLVTTDNRFKITNAFDSVNKKVTLDINNASGSIAIPAGETLTFKNGTVVEVSTATTVQAGSPQVVNVVLKEVPPYSIPLGTQLTFNDGSKVTVAETISISAFNSTSVQVQAQSDTALQPNTGDTTKLSRSNQLRTFVNVDVTSAYDGSTDSNLQLKLNESQLNKFTLKQGTEISFNNGQTIVTVGSDTEINPSTATAVPVTTTSATKTIAANQSTTASTPFEAQITILDNDTPGVRVTTDLASKNVVSGTFNTTEAGGEQTFYSRLESEPLEPVSVFVGSSKKEEGLLDGKEVIELQFDRTNWNIPQAFTVKGVDDLIQDGNVAYNLKTTVESRGDLNYREGAIDIDVLQGLNNGKVQLELNELNIEKAQLPQGTKLNFSNGTVATVGQTVTLDNDETNTPVDVSVTIEPNTLGFGATSSNGSWQVSEAYNHGLKQVELRNTTGNPITLTKNQTIKFNNGGELRIDADITIAENSRDLAKATLTTNPNTLPLLAVGTTNNNGNFEVTTTYNNTQKQLGLKNTTGTAKNLKTGDIISFTDGTSFIVTTDVTIAANSTSKVSGALEVSGLTTSFIKDISPDINLSNTDNDVAGLVLVNVEEIAAKEGVSNNFYKVELKTEPTDTVTVVMTPSDDQIALEGKLPGEPLTITYDATNWNVPQTIGVTAVDDFEVEFDHTTNIAFDTSNSADSVYAGLNVSNAGVKVNIIDNDLPTASVLSVAGAIEANAPGYFTINLDKPLPDKFDDTGLKINYTVSGTADTNGVSPTDDLQPIATGSARIAPGESRTPLIAFPIDDFKAEGTPLEVVGAYNGTSISLKVKNGVSLDNPATSVVENTVTLKAGTKLTFSNGAIGTVGSDVTFNQTGNKAVNITKAPESSKALNTIAVADTTRIASETVIVEVTAGNGYQVSSDENIATLEIEDNDIPGVRVVEASERTTVTEGEAPAQYFISLLTEPTADVTINIAPVQKTRNLTVTKDLSGGVVELKVNDPKVNSLLLPVGTVLNFGGGKTATVAADTFVGSKGNSVNVNTVSGSITTGNTTTYSYQELSSTNSLTFNSNNWYQLQPVNVTGLDDNVAEVGNTHEATLEYTITSGDSDYNNLKVPAQIIDIKDRPFDPNTTASSLTQGLLTFQESLDTLSLPLIGTLEGTAPPFIRNVITDVVAEVRAMEFVTGEKLAKAFTNSFNNNINNGGAVTVEITDLSSSNISFKVNATDKFNNTPISLASDLGLPALGIGMETNGNLNANFDYNFDFAFGLNDTDGFYIDTANTNLNANAAVKLSDNFNAKGSLGFLQLDMTNGINVAQGDTKGTEVNATFDIGLKDANNKLTVTELKNLRKQGKLSSILDYGFAGDAALDVDVVTSVKGSTALPSYSFNLFSDLPLFNYTNAAQQPPQPTTVSIAGSTNVSIEEKTAKSINISIADNGNNKPNENIRLPKGTQLVFTWGNNNQETAIIDKTVTIAEGSIGAALVKLKSDNVKDNNKTVTINSNASAKLEAGAFNIAFNNMTLDFGSFVTGVVSPVVDFLANVVEPITPVVNALNEPIGFFNDVGLTSEFDQNGDGQANIIEVAGTIIEKLPSRGGKAKIDYIQFFDAIVGVTELVGAVKDLQSSLGAGNNFAIDFGSYTLQNFQGASPTTSAADVNPQTQGSSQLNSNTRNQSQNKGLGKQSLSQKVDKMFGALDKLGISIPVLEDPFTAINLFLGNDIDLITYDMPALDIQYEINNKFTILNLPPVDGLIQGEFSVFSDLVFGLDTVGFSAWEKTGFDPAQSYLVLDGLYLSDVDPNTGVDVDELSVDATMAIGAKLNAVVASATVLGGITGEVGLDVVDIGEYTGQSDGKIRGSEVFSRISNPLSLFELAGSIEAFFRAIVKVGVDLGFFEITKTVYDKELARVPIFEFALGGAPGGGGSTGGGSGSNAGTAASGYIEGGTVFLDTNFNLAPDPLEPKTTTDELGNYNLEFELALFDANENGKIDDDEGQIVVVGGTDVTTGLPLAISLVGNATTGSVVTPITTIKNGLEQLGLDVKTANKILSKTLGLDSDLDDFDAYEAQGEDLTVGVNTALSHILLHSLTINGAAFLKGAGFDGNAAESAKILTDAIVKKLSTEDEVELEEKADIEAIFNSALQEIGIDSVDPTTVSNVATLVSAFNDFMEDLLEIEQEDDDDEDEDEGNKPKSVNDIIPTITPFKNLLLGDLPELTERLTRGELTLEEVYESLDSKLNQTGYQLRVVEEVEGEDGEIEIEVEFIIEEITQGATGKIANIQGGTVFLDTNFNEKFNGKDTSTVIEKSGKFVLDFENATYDKNGNNKVDSDEGQIVVIGAVDALTGVALNVPLVANVASPDVVSGLTTLKVGLERLGITSLEAGKIINRIFELAAEDLESFNPYKEKGDDFDEGIDGVRADILIKSLLVHGDTLLKNAGFSGNSFDVVLEGIAQKLNSVGNNFRLNNTNRIRQVFEEILTVAEVTVEPEVVETVAELINSFNNSIGNILEEKKDRQESVVNRSLGQIAPLQEMLLAELPKVTRRLTRGNMTVEQAFESVESQLSERGFDFIVKNNGKTEIDFTNQELKGNAEDDTINGSGGDDTIIGGFGNDMLRSLGGQDVLEGRPENDHLLGGSGDDVLNGGIGRDRLNGGLGKDTMTGGASIDRFIFAINGEFDDELMGSDRITDFNPGQDIILLDKDTFTELESNSGTGFSVQTEFASVTEGVRTSEALIVYNSNNGRLFYNQNGSEPGFGEGGEFAVLAGKPDISAEDFFVR